MFYLGVFNGKLSFDQYWLILLNCRFELYWNYIKLLKYQIWIWAWIIETVYKMGMKCSKQLIYVLPRIAKNRRNGVAFNVLTYKESIIIIKKIHLI